MATDPAAQDFTDPDDFWEMHKTKIIGYGVVALLAIGGWGVYEYRHQAKISASETAFATASTPEELKSVAEEYAGTPAAGNATLKYAEKLREEKKYDEAVNLLRDFVSKETRYPLLAGAWTSLAATVELQGRVDEAIALYQEIVTKFPQESAAALALVSQGRLLVTKGDKEAAIRVYQDLTTRYPESVFAMEARRELQLLQQEAPEAPHATPQATPEASPPAQPQEEEAAAPTPAPSVESTPVAPTTGE